MTFLRPSIAILISIGMLSGSQVLAFEFTSLGDAGGWKEQPVSIVLDESDYTLDVSTIGVDTALINAFDTWANASSTDRLSFERLSDSGGNYDVFDGADGSLDQSADWRYANITIGGWLDASFFESLAPGGGQGILAVSFAAKLRGGSSNKPLWDSDIFFNDYFDWQDDFDIETVALHELGHSIGLGHEDTEPSVMASIYQGENRQLYPDDLAGLAAIYGAGGGGGGGSGSRRNGPPGGNGPPGQNLFGDGPTLVGVTLVDGFSANLSAAAVPEPNASALAMLSLFCFAASGRRKKI